MGEVFLARSGELSGFEKLCVIKKVLPHLAEDTEFIRRFIDEAQVAIKLNHANIASVFEVGMAEGEYFLAIDYIEGRDLRRTLARLHERRERLPIDLALYIVREIASGLAYAHRRTDAMGQPLNLVHCDISPPNVLVSFEGEVKIIDFGIAKSALRITATNPRSGFGKLGYMAPEQLVRGGAVDRRTDVYAAGVLLYELLTGERLFHIPEAYDYKEIARAVTQGRHPTPSQRDPALYDLDGVVMRALAVDQAKRYSTAEELRDDLSVALARVNPTITGDRLGEVLRGLFGEELEEERQSVAQATALDISRWADELTDSRTQTVSFALAGQPDVPVLPALVAVPAAPTPPPGERSLTQLVERAEAIKQTRRRGRVIAASAAGASLVIGAALALAVSRGGKATELAAAAPPDGAPTTAFADPGPPVVRPLGGEPTPEPTIEIEPSPSPAPSAGKARSHGGKVGTSTAAKAQVRPPPPKGKDPPSAATGPTQPEVESKFQAVKREYGTFRKAYGSRLDDEWNDILDVATLGRGEDRWKKLAQKLDRFQKRMAQIRTGG
jgi:serine/threonine-protein kinase